MDLIEIHKCLERSLEKLEVPGVQVLSGDFHVSPTLGAESATHSSSGEVPELVEESECFIVWSVEFTSTAALAHFAHRMIREVGGERSDSDPPIDERRITVSSLRVNPLIRTDIDLRDEVVLAVDILGPEFLFHSWRMEIARKSGQLIRFARRLAVLGSWGGSQ